MNWTDRQLASEWEYRYQERLGILCADRQESMNQHLLAKAEADVVVAELIKHEGNFKTS